MRILNVMGEVYNAVERVRSLSSTACRRRPGLYARRHEISNLHVFSRKAVQQYRAAGLLPLKRRLLKVAVELASTASSATRQRQLPAG